MSDFLSLAEAASAGEREQQLHEAAVDLALGSIVVSAGLCTEEQLRELIERCKATVRAEWEKVGEQDGPIIGEREF